MRCSHGRQVLLLQILDFFRGPCPWAVRQTLRRRLFVDNSHAWRQPYACSWHLSQATPSCRPQGEMRSGCSWLKGGGQKPSAANRQSAQGSFPALGKLCRHWQLLAIFAAFLLSLNCISFICRLHLVDLTHLTKTRHDALPQRNLVSNGRSHSRRPMTSRYGSFHP